MLLEVKNLCIEFHTFDGVVHAVNNVSFQVEKGTTLGIVGESGSGKSVATHAILKLLPMPPGKIVGGEILFQEKDLLKMSERELNAVRGHKIGMIFQEPMTSLNPVFTVENQIVEALRLHIHGRSKADYRSMAIDSLRAVGIPSPETRIKCYPHELSGGMRQRVMIAMALACNPDLLIADEPSTALDVTIQAQILEIINDLKRTRDLGVILITHDLGVIAETAQQIAVMYAGRIVELGKAEDIFNRPLHPYTIGLLESIPSHSSEEKFDLTRRLKTIPGMVPDMRTLPKGCAFAARCPISSNECQAILPELKEAGDNHLVACIKR